MWRLVIFNVETVFFNAKWQALAHLENYGPGTQYTLKYDKEYASAVC